MELQSSKNDFIPSREPAVGWQQLMDWIISKTAEYIGGKSLEIFSGTGEFSHLFMEAGIQIILSDPGEQNCIILRNQYSTNSDNTPIHQIDPAASNFEFVYSNLFQEFDSIFAFNFLRYRPLSARSLDNLKKLIRPGGFFSTWMQIPTALYGNTEHAFNYWHRYNKITIRKELGQNMEIVKMRYFRCMNMEQEDSKREIESDSAGLVPAFYLEKTNSLCNGVYTIIVAQLV